MDKCNPTEGAFKLQNQLNEQIPHKQFANTTLLVVRLHITYVARQSKQVPFVIQSIRQPTLVFL